jgi:uncharacterized damage-inducible protein DinB
VLKHLEDFVVIWGHESAKTHLILGALTDASLTHRVTPDGRTLGYLGWHLSSTIREMLNLAGIPTQGPAYDEPAPARAREIVGAYATAAGSVGPAVLGAWRDADLARDVPMYGRIWSGHDVLERFLFHEIHHRGQMTVVMRQAGLRVPGIYGPAREEWAALGLPAMP